MINQFALDSETLNELGASLAMNHPKGLEYAVSNQTLYCCVAFLCLLCRWLFAHQRLDSSVGSKVCHRERIVSELSLGVVLHVSASHEVLRSDKRGFSRSFRLRHIHIFVNVLFAVSARVRS